MGKIFSCPRCRVELVESRGARIAAHACPECGGVWLAASLAERLRDALESGREIGLCGLARDAGESAAATARGNATTDGRGIPCAICRAPMGREILPRAGLAIDTCIHHGTWYDRGELQSLVDCVRDPSLAGPPLARTDQVPAPSPARTASHPGLGAALVGGAAAGAVGLAAGSALAGSPADELQRQVLRDGGNTAGSVGEGVADAAGGLLDVADVADAAGGVAEGAAEAGFSLIEVIAGLFDF